MHVSVLGVPLAQWEDMCVSVQRQTGMCFLFLFSTRPSPTCGELRRPADRLTTLSFLTQSRLARSFDGAVDFRFNQVYQVHHLRDIAELRLKSDKRRITMSLGLHVDVVTEPLYVFLNKAECVFIRLCGSTNYLGNDLLAHLIPFPLAVGTLGGGKKQKKEKPTVVTSLQPERCYSDRRRKACEPSFSQGCDR